MSYEIRFTNQFKKDIKLAKKQGKDIDKLFSVVDILAAGGTLPPKYRDHELSGNYKGCRECHIEPDWLLKQTGLEPVTVPHATFSRLPCDNF